jgi:thiol:disulfide interchange protein
MRRLMLVVAACGLVCGALGPTARAHTGAAPREALVFQAAQSTPPAEKFDPARDADRDIKDAVAEARRTNRRVILDVGGEWCGWCHTLDRYFAEHPDLRDLRDRSYVWLKVNYSPDNKNEAVLSRYPRINGYPHFFVLDQDGKLLQSQDTSLLEEGRSYGHDKMQQFLLRWAPGR